MSNIQEARITLQEFEQWREAKLDGGPDLSAEAYLREMESADNGRRVEEALAAVDHALGSFDDVDENGTDGEKMLAAGLERIRDILVGDRETIEVHSLGELSVRRYVV